MAAGLVSGVIGCGGGGVKVGLCGFGVALSLKSLMTCLDGGLCTEMYFLGIFQYCE